MPENITWIEEVDGREEEYSIPAKWKICPVCKGDGAHSLRLAALTSDDIDDWSHDMKEDYFSGGYDSECEECAGSGKVLVPASPNGKLVQRYLNQEALRLDLIREDQRTMYLESGGTMGSRNGGREESGT